MSLRWWASSGRGCQGLGLRTHATPRVPRSLWHRGAFAGLFWRLQTEAFLCSSRFRKPLIFWTLVQAAKSPGQPLLLRVLLLLLLHEPLCRRGPNNGPVDALEHLTPRLRLGCCSRTLWRWGTWRPRGGESPVGRGARRCFLGPARRWRRPSWGARRRCCCFVFVSGGWQNEFLPVVLLPCFGSLVAGLGGGGATGCFRSPITPPWHHPRPFCHKARWGGVVALCV